MISAEKKGHASGQTAGPLSDRGAFRRPTAYVSAVERQARQDPGRELSIKLEDGIVLLEFKPIPERSYTLETAQGDFQWSQLEVFEGSINAAPIGRSFPATNLFIAVFQALLTDTLTRQRRYNVIGCGGLELCRVGSHDHLTYWRFMVWRTMLLFLAGASVTLLGANYELSPEADARVIDIPGEGFPNANFEKDILSVYTAAGNVQRTFMRFDFAGVNLPAGQRVSSAVLTLNASTGFGGSGGKPTEIYRVTQPWTEKGLTWRRRDTNLPWAAPGGDYVGRLGAMDSDPYASNSQVVNTAGEVTWDLTTLVIEWLEGAVSNNGLLLRSYTGNGLTFVPRENADADHRPKLLITISAGPPLLRVDSWSGGQVVFSWRGENVAVLEQADSLAPSNWSPSPLAVTVANGRSQVTAGTSAGRKFFRLRSP